MDTFFYFFKKLLSAFLSYFCQDTNKTRSDCAIIDCNLSKKHTKTCGQTSKYYRAG